MINHEEYIARRDKNDNPYAHLQQKSIATLQRLSGRLWTDFNAHDPGVTILDALNSALDELRYKLDFPLPDYLADPDTGLIPFEQMGLLPFDGLLRGSVVTARDYEKLMVDNIPEITACRATLARGRYRFAIHTRAANRHDTVSRAAQLYHANRNLCETLGSIVTIEAPPPRHTAPIDEAPGTDRDNKSHTHRNITACRPVRFDLPDCYGVNRRGMPPHTSTHDKVRIQQLQAYLLIFDHLMACALQQVAGTGARMFPAKEITPEKWPETDVTGVEHLIDEDKRGNHPGGALDFAMHQRKAWLDVLDMLYGERTVEYSTDKRAATITDLPELNRLRSRAFDIHDRHSLPVVQSFPESSGRGASILVEHILLHPDGEVPEEDLHHISLLHPAWSDKNGKWHPIRERLPAHVTLDIRGISHCQWVYLETTYTDWREALADDNAAEIKTTSEKLRRFLELV